jgi:hypothetical protein
MWVDVPSVTCEWQLILNFGPDGWKIFGFLVNAEYVVRYRD